MDQNIVWPEVFAQLPWVTRLKRGTKCTGFMGHTPLKMIFQIGKKPLTEAEHEALVKKYSCKNSARWRFRGLKAKDFRPDNSGTYCWSHLISRGIFGGMEEEHRTLKWFKRYDPELANRIARSRGLTSA